MTFLPQDFDRCLSHQDWWVMLGVLLLWQGETHPCRWAVQNASQKCCREGRDDAKNSKLLVTKGKDFLIVILETRFLFFLLVSAYSCDIHSMWVWRGTHTMYTKATQSRDVTELRAALKQGLAWGLEEAELQRVTGLWLCLWDAGWKKVRRILWIWKFRGEEYWRDVFSCGNLWCLKVWRVSHTFPQHPWAKARMILKQAFGIRTSSAPQQVQLRI